MGGIRSHLQHIGLKVTESAVFGEEMEPFQKIVTTI